MHDTRRLCRGRGSSLQILRTALGVQAPHTSHQIMSAAQDPIPSPPENTRQETKYEANDKVLYYRMKKWRKGKVLKSESSEKRYAVEDDENKEIYHVEIEKVAKIIG
ncbi:MAG: hypothetical protein Q9181_006584 [Wetmoreana brouardii]